MVETPTGTERVPTLEPAASAARFKPVVVTRAEGNEGPLSSALRELGLTVLLWPAVSVTVPESAPLSEALGSVTSFDWIVFASRHAADAVMALLPVQPRNVRVAAVGASTAKVLRQRGWSVDLLPAESNAAALVSAFAALPLSGVRVLYPASSRALPTITTGLRQLGADVTQIEAYRTDPAPLDVERCRAWIERDGLGAVTFASPSAVIELELAFGKELFARLLRAGTVVMGPSTAREISVRGGTAVKASSATLPELARATLRWLEERRT